MEMPLSVPMEFQKALEEGAIQEAEEFFVSHFEERLDEIETYLITGFPHRARILGSAFRAHRNKDFDLSVPVFLAQADGICNELTGHHYFLKHQRTAIYVEAIALETYEKALLEPFSHTLPISANEKERDKNFNELNRHMVLHGESLDYGTQKYSCKALSLLNYVAQVLSKDEEREQDGKET